MDVVKLKQKFEFEDGKLNTKLLLVDWNKTWNYWKSNEEAAKKKKLIYFTNEHTDNYRYKFNWDKCSIHMGKARMYSFNPSDLLSDKLGEYLLDPETIKNYPEKC